jgi:general secretion pathway protein G
MNHRHPQTDTGFSLVELIAVVVILGILASAVMPMTKIAVKRAKEIELHRTLREIRRAIDLYKKMADDKKIEHDATDSGYPESLEVLVEGVELTGTERKMVFLRRIPRDPITGEREWGLRGLEDEPDAYSWSGEDVFDVYSLSEARALDGSYYREW